MEEGTEVQSVVRGFQGHIQRLEDRGLSGGLGGRGAGGVLRGQRCRHTLFSHQDLAKDDGEQEKEKPFGRARILDWQLAPDLTRDNTGKRSGESGLPHPPPPRPSPAAHFGDTHHRWVEDPTAALSVHAGDAGARCRNCRELRERVEGEDLGTGAPPGSRAGGGGRGRGPQDGHGGEVAARVTHGVLHRVESRV